MTFLNAICSFYLIKKTSLSRRLTSTTNQRVRLDQNEDFWLFVEYPEYTLYLLSLQSFINCRDSIDRILYLNIYEINIRDSNRLTQ